MAYQLMLLDDVEALGKKGDLVSVRSGYARNFLLPQKLAVVASPQALRRQKKLQEERAQQAIRDKQESEAVASRLNGSTYKFIVKVDQEGHMYGSVTPQDIAALIEKETSIAVDKRRIALKHALKETGSHKVVLKLKEDVACEVIVEIEPESQAPKPA